MATYTTGDNKLELMESGGTLRDELEKNNRNMEKIDNKLSGVSEQLELTQAVAPIKNREPMVTAKNGLCFLTGQLKRLMTQQSQVALT